MPQFGLRPTPAATLNPALDDATVVQVLVETPAGVARADEIAAVDGVDMLAFGANDSPPNSARPAGTPIPVSPRRSPPWPEPASGTESSLMVGGIADPALLRDLDASASARCG